MLCLGFEPGAADNSKTIQYKYPMNGFEPLTRTLKYFSVALWTNL